jgi:DNA repair exonuclease SbcCD nuclease subunit
VVAVLGDWGTGLSDAADMLAVLMRQHNPTVILHLGDIYYSGTPSGIPGQPDYPGECQDNFLNVIASVFQQAGISPVPVFTIPGNHEYYSWAVG